MSEQDTELLAMDTDEEQEGLSGEDEAAYAAESSVKCPLCSAMLSTVNVIRLLRTKVNFTSSLPRRGYMVICPECRGVIPAAIVSWLS